MAQYHVVDSISKVPIPYVIVSINDKNTGTYTDESGNFEFNDLTEDNILVFKHIGYNQKEIKFKNIISNNLIELTPINYLLKEVTVTNKKLKDIEIGFSTLKSNSNFSVGKIGSEIATLVKNPNFQGKTVKALVIRIKKIKNINSLVRLHIYKNNDGAPGDELFIKNNQIIVNNNIKDKIVLDISQSYIKYPVDGFFISLEWLGEIDINNKLSKNTIVISPKSKIRTVDIDPKIFFRTWGIKWSNLGKFPTPIGYFQPLFGIIIEP